MASYTKINKTKLVLSFLMTACVFLIPAFIKQEVHAANRYMNFQTKIVSKSDGLNLTDSIPCIIPGPNNDTCDFRVRIWNLSTGGTASAGNNLMFEELHQNIEIGETEGIFNITINSVCNSNQQENHQWSTTAAAAAVCSIIDDNDADTTVGVNFDRSDLWLEITFDPSGAWTNLSSPPGGIEVFTRVPVRSVASAFVAQYLLGGFLSDDLVKFAPSTGQTTSKTNSLINLTTTANTTNPLFVINETGATTPDLIDLRVASDTVFKVANEGSVHVAQDLLSYVTPANAPTLEWSSREVSGSGSSFSRGVKVAQDGSVYAVGNFSGTVDFGSGNLGASGSDYFLVKHDSEGNFQWVRREVGGTGSPTAYGLATALDGSVYTVGTFNSTVDFGSGSLTAGSNDYFLVKHDSTGTFQWVRREIGGSGIADARAVAVSTDGSVYAVGSFQAGDVDFGSGLLTPTGGDYFLVKYDSAGNFQWVRREAGGTGNVQANGVTVASDGSVYTVGSFSGTVDFGSGSLAATGSDYFIVKHDSSGNFQWVRREVGGSGSPTASGVSIGSDGGVYISGWFSGTVDFGSGNLVASGDDFFALKYDNAGNFQWVRREVGGTGSVNSFGIKNGPDDSVYIVGYFNGTVNFGSGSLSAGGDDYFITKYDNIGNFQWVRREVGGAGTAQARSVAVAEDGSIYTVGYFNGTVDFGGGSLAATSDDYVSLKHRDTGSNIGTQSNPFANIHVANTRADRFYFTNNNYIDYGSSAFRFNTLGQPVFEITEQGDIRMNNGSTKNIVNYDGRNLVQITDVATNFGAYVESGAMISRNSYFGEEFLVKRANVTATTNFAWGDILNWNTVEQAAGTNDCTFLILDDVSNGISRIRNEQDVTGCRIHSADNDGTLMLSYNLANLPVLVMKVRLGFNTAGDAARFGLGQSFTNVYYPDNGIYFGHNTSNWVGLARSSSPAGFTSRECVGQTPSTTQFALLKFEVVSTSEVKFYVDPDVSNGISWHYCGSVGTHIPTHTNLGLFFGWYSVSGTSRYVDVDYIRAWQDDSPEASPYINLANSTLVENDSEISEVNNEENSPIQTQTTETVELDSNSSSLTTGKIIELSGLRFSNQDEMSLMNISSIAGATIALDTSEINILGNLLVSGTLNLSGDLEIYGDLKLSGRVALSSSNLGEITIPAGQDVADIQFNSPREEKFFVFLTPKFDYYIEGYSGYKISNMDKHGFRINLNQLLDSDITFNWFLLNSQHLK